MAKISETLYNLGSRSHKNISLTTNRMKTSSISLMQLHSQRIINNSNSPTQIQTSIRIQLNTHIVLTSIQVFWEAQTPSMTTGIYMKLLCQITISLLTLMIEPITSNISQIPILKRIIEVTILSIEVTTGNSSKLMSLMDMTQIILKELQTIGLTWRTNIHLTIPVTTIK